MQKENKSEYEFIRKELSELRNCITTYMGFVIGGSGVFIFIISMLYKAQNDNPDLFTIHATSIIIALLVSSIIVSLVLLILFYKFNSYNRYAGYCKLLNQEKYHQGSDDQFMSWEVCIDVLREADFDKYLLLNLARNVAPIEGATDLIKIIELYYPHKRSFKKSLCRWVKGFMILMKAFTGRGKSRSWNFPVDVVLVFATLEIIDVVFGIAYYVTLNGEDTNLLLHLIFWGIITIQVYGWSHFFIRFYDIMEGKNTINAYCWRFLPIRYAYIQQQTRSNIRYSIITLKPDEINLPICYNSPSQKNIII